MFFKNKKRWQNKKR